MNSRALRATGPAILVVAALVTLIAGLALGGGAAPLLIGDPGPVARWGLPVAKLLVNLSAAGMVGALVLALFALRAGEREFDVALDTASVSAAVFTVSAAATGFLTFVDAFNPNTAEVDDLKERYRAGKVGDVEVKTKLAAAINAMLEPIRERHEAAIARPGYLREVLVEGSARARRVAQATMEQVREAVRLRY